MASAKVIAAHNKTDDAEAASIGARVDSHSGKWYSLKDGHYIGPAEADQLLGRTTAQGNADREQGNGGGYFNQLAARNQDSVGNLLKNVAPIAGLIPGIGPLLAGGIAAGGQALIPGANLGDSIKSGIQGGGLGAGVGALGGATGLTSALGLGKAALPSVSAVNMGKMAADGTLANVADAGSTLGTQGVSDLASALPGVGAVSGSGVLNAGKQLAGAGGGSSNGGGSADSGGITGLLNSLGTTIPAIAGGINAANLQGQSQQYAQDALKTQTGLFDQTAPLRTAGIAGMLNPSTPAPGMPEIAALRQIAGTGNPFAPKPSALPAGGAAPAPNVPAGLPTPSPVGGPQIGAPIAPMGKPLPPQAGLPTPAPVGAGGGNGTNQLVM